MTKQLLAVTTREEAAAYRAAGLWTDETVSGRFLKAAGKVPDKVALVCGARQLTYAELRQQVDAIAGNLLQHGVRRGDVVSVQVSNSIELPLIHIALDRIGAIFMPVHLGFQETELRHLLPKAEVTVAIMLASYQGQDFPALYRTVMADAPSVRLLFSIGASSEGAQSFERLLQPSGISSEELDKHAASVDEVAQIMLSSGTTAMPKVSVFTNNNVMSLMGAFTGRAGITGDDIGAVIAPMGTGATGYIYPLLPMITSGGTAVILEHWSDPAEAVELIVKHKCTYATGIPTQLTLMLAALEARPRSDFAAFRVFNNAGAPLPPEVGRRIEELMTCRVQSVYGSTDGGVPCMTAFDDPIEKRLGTVGRPLPGREIEIRNPDGSALGPNENGEICWKGPDKSFGYLNDIEAARLAFDAKGFYKSGDLGRLDEDGYISIVGRVKDMILRGGRNISPRLIEDLLIQHPAVREVAVAAMPHPTLGEQACAFVVLESATRLTLDDAIVFLTEKKIAKWQLPERIEIMSELPVSAAAKVSKNTLTAYITEKLRAERGEQ